MWCFFFFFFFSSRRRHTRLQGDWSSDVCSSDLRAPRRGRAVPKGGRDARGHAAGGARPGEHHPRDDGCGGEGGEDAREVRGGGEGGGGAGREEATREG